MRRRYWTICAFLCFSLIGMGNLSAAELPLFAMGRRLCRNSFLVPIDFSQYRMCSSTRGPSRFALYQERFEVSKNILKQYLLRNAGDKDSVDTIAVMRRAITIMERQFYAPTDVISLFDRITTPKLPGPDIWWSNARLQAEFELFPEKAHPELYKKKLQEYIDYAERIKQTGIACAVILDEGFTPKVSIYKTNDYYLIQASRVIASEFSQWVTNQSTFIFFENTPEQALNIMINEKSNLLVLLRTAQKLAFDDQQMREQARAMPWYVDAFELGIGLLPYIGNSVAAYEIARGRNLFGYPLSDAERALMAAFILVPAAYKFTKFGKALYGERRLVSMYGREGKQWGRILSMTERASTEANLLKNLEEAGTGILSREASHVLSTPAVEALEKLSIFKPYLRPALPADTLAIEAFEKFSLECRAIKNLDEYAMERILAKGASVEHVKGQLLEEMIESQIVPWLGKRASYEALGVSVPAGKQLEFIAGHRLQKGIGSRQATDGLLGFYHNDGTLEIVGVFEAKAGKRSARDLHYTSGSKKAETKADALEYRSEMKDHYLDLRAEHVKEGKDFTLTFKEFLEEGKLRLSGRGGQIAQDIERLSEFSLMIDGKEVATNFILPKVKFFAVVPNDVNLASVERGIEKIRKTPNNTQKLNYEVIGVKIKEKELKTLAEKLLPSAEKFIMKDP